MEYSHELAKQITLQKENTDSQQNQKYWSGGFDWPGHAQIYPKSEFVFNDISQSKEGPLKSLSPLLYGNDEFTH